MVRLEILGEKGKKKKKRCLVVVSQEILYFQLFSLIYREKYQNPVQSQLLLSTCSVLYPQRFKSYLDKRNLSLKINVISEQSW